MVKDKLEEGLFEATQEIREMKFLLIEFLIVFGWRARNGSSLLLMLLIVFLVFVLNMLLNILGPKNRGL